jgi:hypothetical protein
VSQQAGLLLHPTPRGSAAPLDGTRVLDVSAPACLGAAGRAWALRLHGNRHGPPAPRPPRLAGPPCRLWISAVIGVAMFLAFCWLQRASSLYRFRVVSERCKPGSVAPQRPSKHSCGLGLPLGTKHALRHADTGALGAMRTPRPGAGWGAALPADAPHVRRTCAIRRNRRRCQTTRHRSRPQAGDLYGAWPCMRAAAAGGRGGGVGP